jgi:heme-degrading monooxygenase HmoA
MTTHDTRVVTRTAVANCIAAPIDLSDWIIRSFAATFATLSQVPGVREFRLRRLAFVGPKRLCVIVSITIWDDLGQFEVWRNSDAFRAAHPDRAAFSQEFAVMRSIRLDLEVSPGTTFEELDAQIVARLAIEHPELVPSGSRLVPELGWTAPASGGFAPGPAEANPRDGVVALSQPEHAPTESHRRGVAPGSEPGYSWR